MNSWRKAILDFRFQNADLELGYLKLGLDFFWLIQIISIEIVLESFARIQVESFRTIPPRLINNQIGAGCFVY